MPRVDSRPLQEDPSLMANIQSEVSRESRPLLDFILANAKYLVGIVVILIVALLGTAVYRYIESNRQQETLDQLAKIMQPAPSAQQLASLESLAASCPSGMRTAVAVAMVQSAVAQNLPDKAEAAYALVSQSEYDTPTGLVAAINQAGMLMRAEKYAEGVKVLQAILPRLGQQSGVQAKMMLAEGAARAKNYTLAAETYDGLAATATSDIEKDYCTTRARDLRAMASAEAADKAESQAPAAR